MKSETPRRLEMSSSFGSNMPSKHSVVARVRSFLGSDGEGGALVEMAVTLPVLLLLMTGIFSFSVALYQKLQLAEAVGNAGRTLAVDRGSADPCQDATTAIYAAAPGLTQSSLTLTYTLNGVVTKGKSCYSAGVNGNTNMVAGQNAEIQATYTGCFLNVMNIWGKSMTGPCTLYAQVTEVVQ
jgi:Flp pilus assembly protein TadG